MTTKNAFSASNSKVIVNGICPFDARLFGQRTEVFSLQKAYIVFQKLLLIFFGEKICECLTNSCEAIGKSSITADNGLANTPKIFAFCSPPPSHPVEACGKLWGSFAQAKIKRLRTKAKP